MGNQLCQKEDQNPQLDPKQKQIMIHKCFLKHLKNVEKEFPQLENQITNYKQTVKKDLPNISIQLQNDEFIKFYFKNSTNQLASIQEQSLDAFSNQNISKSQLLYDKKIHTIQFQSLIKQLSQSKDMVLDLKLCNRQMNVETIEYEFQQILIQIFKILHHEQYFVQHYLNLWCRICHQFDIQEKDTLILSQKFILQLLYLFLSELYSDFGFPREFKQLSTIILKQIIFTLVFNKKVFLNKNVQYFQLQNFEEEPKNDQLIDQIYHVNSPVDKYYAFYMGNQELVLNETITDQDQREYLIAKFLTKYNRTKALYYQLHFIEAFKSYCDDIISLNWCTLQLWQTVAYRFIEEKKIQ